LIEVRDEFDLSASANWTTPSTPISLLPELSENEMKQFYLLFKASEVRDVFNLSASDNLIATSVPISFPV
jgi:hypothetical protein